MGTFKDSELKENIGILERYLHKLGVEGKVINALMFAVNVMKNEREKNHVESKDM